MVNNTAGGGGVGAWGSHTGLVNRQPHPSDTKQKVNEIISYLKQPAFIQPTEQHATIRTNPVYITSAIKYIYKFFLTEIHVETI